MPFLRLTVYPAPDAEPRARMSKALTDLMHRILLKKVELTSVLVESPPAVCWTLGGRPLLSTAVLEVNVTTGSNTDAEKAAFIGAAHAVLRNHLPDLEDVCYVVIREVPPSAWGYDGITQAHRQTPSAADRAAVG